MLYLAIGLAVAAVLIVGARYVFRGLTGRLD